MIPSRYVAHLFCFKHAFTKYVIAPPIHLYQLQGMLSLAHINLTVLLGQEHWGKLLTLDGHCEILTHPPMQYGEVVLHMDQTPLWCMGDIQQTSADGRVWYCHAQLEIGM